MNRLAFGNGFNFRNGFVNGLSFERDFNFVNGLVNGLSFGKGFNFRNRLVNRLAFGKGLKIWGREIAGGQKMLVVCFDLKGNSVFERGSEDFVEKIIPLNGDISFSFDEFVYFADFLPYQNRELFLGSPLFFDGGSEEDSRMHNKDFGRLKRISEDSLIH